MKARALLPIMTSICLVLIVAVLALMGACAEPAPAPAPAPTPTPSPAPAKPINLLASSWEPPGQPVTVMLEEWGKDFEQKTGGRYTVEVVPGGALAGMPQAYDAVVSGIADVAQFVPPMTERPFPLVNLPSLPFGDFSAADGSKALFESVYLKGYLDKDFADIRALGAFVGNNEDCLSQKPINGLADLKGLKFVGGGMFLTDIIQRLGAIPVQGGPPDAYLMVQKGVVDGIWIAAVGIEMLQWDEVISYMNMPLRACHMAHGYGMNKDTYNKMPDDVKAIVDEMGADPKYVLICAKAWDGMYNAGVSRLIEKGGTIIEEWDKEAVAELEKVIAPIWGEHIAKLEAQGLPAKKVIDEYYNALKALGVEKPAIGYTPGG